MVITPEQVAQRRRYIGSSDSAALFGLDPFKMATDVYWSKVAEAPNAGKAAEAGNMLEPGIRDWVASDLGITITPDVSKTLGNMIANLDGLTDDKRIVEIKLMGIKSPDRHEWGDTGTDQVPKRVMIQVQHQMYVTGVKSAIVACFDGAYLKLNLYSVGYNERIGLSIARKAEAFWRDHVKPKIPPTDDPPPMWVHKQAERDETEKVTIPEDIVEAYHKAKEAEKQAKSQLERHKSMLVVALGAAEWGTTSNGDRVTYKADKNGNRTLRVS